MAANSSDGVNATAYKQLKPDVCEGVFEGFFGENCTRLNSKPDGRRQTACPILEMTCVPWLTGHSRTWEQMESSSLYCNQLTKKEVFRWSPNCEHAFSELKHLLASTPILVFPDFFRSSFMDTDASATGLDAVLSQVSDDGSNMSVFLFLLIWTWISVKDGAWLLSVAEKFLGVLGPDGQMARAATEYNFTIVHRLGKKYCNANALSRVACQQCHGDSHVSLPVTGNE